MSEHPEEPQESVLADVPASDRTEPVKPARSPLPDVGDLLFIGVLSLIVFLAPNMLFGDGSTGWHLATGHYILDKHVVPHTDIISYTFPDQLWVPYEWLWDTLAAGLERLGGLNLLALACATLIAAIFASLYRDMRKEGLHFIPAAVLTLVGSLVSSIHWLARPLLVTWLGIYVFNAVLVKFSLGEASKKHLWLVLCCAMLVWVNSHPAFLLGFSLIVIYLLCEAFQWLASNQGTQKSQHRQRCIDLLVALTLVSLVSLLNPSGFRLYEYIGHYLHQSAILEVTDEFNSPVFHGALYSTALELLFFAFAFGLGTSAKRAPLGQVISVLAFAHLALNAKRNDPLFAIISLPLIGLLLANSSILKKLYIPLTGEIRGQTWLLPVQRIWSSTAASTDEVEATCNMHILPWGAVALLALVCIASAHITGFPSVLECGFDALNKPTKTLAYLKQHNLDPNHGFNLDNWGGYMRYKTGDRVYIDDRSDFYGQKFFQHYGTIAEVRPGWDKLLDQAHISWILFPKNSFLAKALIDGEKTGQSDFRMVAEDPAAYLFVRTKPQ